MCDPVTAGVIMMAAGTAEQNRSSRKSARARSSAKNNYYELNNALMNEAGTAQKTSQDTMEKPAFDEGVAEQYQKLLDGFTGNNSCLLYTSPSPRD